MTVSFADYCASADARERIAANVLEWTEMLCRSLEEDYVNYVIRRCEFFANNSSDNKYYSERLEKHKRGEDCYEFVIESWRKYHKIVMVTDDGSRSAHAFVDKKTGEVYMAASWKAPAKNGVRFDLRIIEQRELCLENCDWAGEYLYKN